MYKFKQSEIKPDKENFFSRELHEKRCREERRRLPSQGYARISIVGWICRRERLRRTNDTCPHNGEDD